jgi:hypothetical protein
VSSSNGSWRSIWTMDFNYELQFVDIKGKIQVGLFYLTEAKSSNLCFSITKSLASTPGRCSLF